MNKRYIKNKLKLLAVPLIQLSGRSKRFLPEKRFWELMHKNFPPGEDFHFIQVGANDGVSFDILFDIAKERKSRGIVIEPLSDFFEKLCSNYAGFPSIIKVNKAAHPSLTTVSLYRVDPAKHTSLQDWTSGIASLDPLHHLKSGTDSKDIIEEKVEALSIMEIIEDAGTGYDVDLLQIDVEGFDYEILKMVDFKKIKPLVIKYEYSNLSINDLNKSKQLLRKNNYHSFAVGDDMIAVSMSSIRF